MVPDSELTKRLREILTTSDLNTTSAGAVRRQLEADLGVDLSHRKKFISQLIDDIIQNDNQQEEEEEEEEEDVEVEAEVEVEDEDEDEDEDKATSSQRCSSPKKKKRASGFTKICGISPQLQLFFGVSQMARTEVVKKLWAYIRDNDLQDPKDRRNIKCDDKLHSIFRVPKINMFQMNKALSKHIWPLEETDTNANANHECSDSSPSQPPKKQKRPKQEDDTDEDERKPKAKQQKGATSGFLKPLHLSDSFVKFLGTGETTLPRTEAVKRIWEYIKLNDLQDPSDKRRILCDEKLKQLFEVDTFIGFSMTKYLKPHLIKAEQLPDMF